MIKIRKVCSWIYILSCIINLYNHCVCSPSPPSHFSLSYVIHYKVCMWIPLSSAEVSFPASIQSCQQSVLWHRIFFPPWGLICHHGLRYGRTKCDDRAWGGTGHPINSHFKDDLCTRATVNTHNQTQRQGYKQVCTAVSYCSIVILQLLMYNYQQVNGIQEGDNPSARNEAFRIWLEDCGGLTEVYAKEFWD